MAISDLLSSRSKTPSGASRSAFAPPGADRRRGGPDRRTVPRDHVDRRRGTDRRSIPRGPVEHLADAVDAVLPADRPALSSEGVAVLGGLTVCVLLLAAALVLVAGGEPALAEEDLAMTTETAPTPADGAPAPEARAFDAEPAAISTSLLTRLEAAADGPLEAEFTLLLEGIETGFGTSSVQLEPTLRSYAYRMASRFVWNPDTFRVDVTAPDQALATARAATLVRLFETAIDDGRLQVRPAVGPHSLSLASR